MLLCVGLLCSFFPSSNCGCSCVAVLLCFLCLASLISVWGCFVRLPIFWCGYDALSDYRHFCVEMVRCLVADTLVWGVVRCLITYILLWVWCVISLPTF